MSFVLKWMLFERMWELFDKGRFLSFFEIISDCKGWVFV